MVNFRMDRVTVLSSRKAAPRRASTLSSKWLPALNHRGHSEPEESRDLILAPASVSSVPSVVNFRADTHSKQPPGARVLIEPFVFPQGRAAARVYAE